MHEIDFVTETYDEVILIEAKAKDGRTKAATEVLGNKEKYKDVKKLIRLKTAMSDQPTTSRRSHPICLS